MKIMSPAFDVVMNADLNQIFMHIFYMRLFYVRKTKRLTRYLKLTKRQHLKYDIIITSIVMRVRHSDTVEESCSQLVNC